MEKKLTLSEIKDLLLHPDPSIQQVKPFFYMVIVAMVILYSMTIYFSPAMRQPLALLFFTLLMVVQTVLHWGFARLQFFPTFARYYFLIQAVLIVTTILVSRNESLVYGLIMPLIGEAVGFFEQPRKAVLATLFCWSIAAACYLIIRGSSQFFVWAVTTLGTSLFVIFYVVLFKRQLIARHEAQILVEELKAAQQRLTDYADQVENLTLINERQRMARELHDTLAQGLAGLILQLEAVDSHLQNGRVERAQGIVQQAMGRARSALVDARRVIDDLRTQLPERLDEAVQMEVDRFSNAAGIPCEVKVELEDDLPEWERELIVRVVSEGLTNIVRHARASQAWVSVNQQNAQLRVEVRDNGVGFDPAVIGRNGHYGLLGVRERARLAGATFEVRSTPGAGTCILFILPTAPEE